MDYDHVFDRDIPQALSLLLKKVLVPLKGLWRVACLPWTISTVFDVMIEPTEIWTVQTMGSKAV